MSIDLTTKYLGLTLRNPLVVSSCPLTGQLETLKNLEAAGAAAIVLPSLFEEQIDEEEAGVNRLYGRGDEGLAAAQSFLPEMSHYHLGPDAYFKLLKQAKQELSIPVIASLNGTTNGGWIRYAQRMAEAGASAIELNVYYVVADPETTSDAVEQRYLDLVAAVKTAVTIPVAVKLGPFFTALPRLARRLAEAGADGLVLFNRFVQPDIDLKTMQPTPRLALSNRGELLLPLRWIAILHGQVKASLAATSGIHFTEDVIKVLLAGADVAMSASALLKHGPTLLTTWVKELSYWLEQNKCQTVAQIRGRLSQRNCPDPEALERWNYVKALTSYANEGPHA